jgi:hypothetical protein
MSCQIEILVMLSRPQVKCEIEVHSACLNFCGAGGKHHSCKMPLFLMSISYKY